MQMKSNLDCHGFPGDFSVASKEASCPTVDGKRAKIEGSDAPKKKHVSVWDAVLLPERSQGA